MFTSLFNIIYLKASSYSTRVTYKIPLYLYLSISIKISIYLSFSIYLFLSIYLSLNIPIYLSLNLPIYLSLNLPIYLFLINVSFSLSLSIFMFSPCYLNFFFFLHFFLTPLVDALSFYETNFSLTDISRKV